MENMKDYEQVHRVTRYYDQLQGLRQVPWGLVFLLIAVWKAGWWPWFEKWHPLSGLLSIGLGLLAFWAVGRYYARTFGQVKQSAESRRQGIIVAVVYLVGMYFVGWAEYLWQWPVSGTGLFTAVMLTAYFFQTGSFRWHYLVLSGLMAVVSLLPLLGILPVEQVYFWGEVGVVGVAAFGLIVIIGGLVDHWLLTRSLAYNQPLDDAT